MSVKIIQRMWEFHYMLLAFFIREFPCYHDAHPQHPGDPLGQAQLLLSNARHGRKRKC